MIHRYRLNGSCEKHCAQMRGAGLHRWLSMDLHCVTKNAPTFASCSFDKHGQVLIIFGKEHFRKWCAYSTLFVPSLLFTLFALSISVDGNDAKRKGKGKVHTLDIAPLRSDTPPQKRSGMARVLKGFHSFTCTPTRSSEIGMSHTCLCIPSRSWYSFTDHGGMEGWVDLGAK